MTLYFFIPEPVPMKRGIEELRYTLGGYRYRSSECPHRKKVFRGTVWHCDDCGSIVYEKE